MKRKILFWFITSVWSIVLISSGIVIWQTFHNNLFDWLLGKLFYLILYLIMFLLSIGYYQGLKWFFRYNFKWDYAAVVGIAFTVCITALVYWLPKYGQSATVDLVSSLFFAFAGALYFMMDFRRILEKDAQERKAYRKRLERYLFDYQQQNQQVQLDIEEILKSQRHSDEMLAEILDIIHLRKLAEQYLKTFEN